MWTLIPLVIGVSLSGVIAPGPFFAVTLAKSYRSPWAGTLMALGHAVVEVPLILLIYFGFAHFFENEVVRIVLSLAGGTMIIWTGFGMFRFRKTVVNKGKDLPYSSFVAGIFMSVANPFFLLWWATVGLLLVMKFLDYGVGGLVLLIVVHWVCDMVWLSCISVLFNKTHRHIGRRFQEWLFIAMALFLAYFGVRFVVTGIQLIIQ
ncbi:MAG: LysE family translocator [Dehalococcoidia bacterium]|nr:LysE family translocator [Dehalococcoidia bacterium]